MKTLIIFNLIAMCCPMSASLKSELPSEHVEREYMWVKHYFDSVDESVDIEDLAEFLVRLRTDLIVKGHSLPPLTDLCIEARNYFVNCGIETDNDMLQAIYEILEEKERPNQNYYILPVKDKTKKEKKIEISKDMATAAAEFVGGALLFLVPIPGAQAIGTGMIADAGRRAYNEVKDKDKDKKKEKKKEKEKPSKTKKK